MPAVFNKTIIRIPIDVTNPNARPKDVYTGGTPAFWNSTDIEIQIAFFKGSDADAELLDVTNFDSVSLKVKPLANRKAAALMAATVGSEEINKTLTLNQWRAGTGQHVTIPFTWSEANLPIPENKDSENFWMVIHGITSDSPVGKDTYGATTLTAVEDGITDDELEVGPVQPGNLVPENAEYNEEGEYELNVEQGKTYSWIKGLNDTDVYNAPETIATSGYAFIANATTIILRGTPNDSVTAIVRSGLFLTADQSDSRYFALNRANGSNLIFTGDRVIQPEEGIGYSLSVMGGAAPDIADTGGLLHLAGGAGGQFGGHVKLLGGNGTFAGASDGGDVFIAGGDSAEDAERDGDVFLGHDGTEARGKIFLEAPAYFSLLASGILAVDENGLVSIGDSDDLAEGVANLFFTNARADARIALQSGVEDGFAPLDAGLKIPTSFLPDSIVGQVEWQGTWNATTNTPEIPAAAADNRGHYYVVATAGATEIDGISDWKVGDWIISNGTAWEKVDNTDQVSSVFGRSGAVVAATNDYTWAQIDKTVSSLADLATRSASDLNSGTVDPARLGTGSGGAAKFLREDNTWQAIPGGGDLLAANNLSDLENAGTARGNLSAAESGANSDITSLSGLTGAAAFSGTGSLTMNGGQLTLTKNSIQLLDDSADSIFIANAMEVAFRAESEIPILTLDRASRMVTFTDEGNNPSLTIDHSLIKFFGWGEVEMLTMDRDAATVAIPNLIETPIEIIVACSDETTALTTGLKTSFRIPKGFTLTGVRAGLTTEQTSGSILTVDIHKDGISILADLLTVDNGERSSLTATTPPAISDDDMYNDAEIDIYIDQIGDGTAKGLKVTFIGKRT